MFSKESGWQADLSARVASAEAHAKMKRTARPEKRPAARLEIVLQVVLKGK
jgi:hypothetical protein